MAKVRHSAPAHLHSWDDGRGLRDVLLNGRLIKRVFFADERRGIVRCYRDPLKVDKHGKRALAKTLRGRVEVRYLGIAT